MPAVTTTIAFVALLLGLTAPVLYFTWMSMQDDAHSPPTDSD